jgi:hypothetical protein
MRGALYRAREAVALAALVAVMAALGCDESDSPSPTASPETDSAPRERAGHKDDRAASSGFRPARCPASATNCRAATGRAIYVERVDPDGDGDLHLVILDASSLSAPGVTVLDVSRELRPNRDPVVGDLVTGAGPVYRGSFGQRQIQVTVFRAAR